MITVTDDIDTCLALRRAVFITEQNVPEELEIDGLDHSATHLLATVDGTAVGTARLMIKDDTGKIGRVCVLPSHRGTGLGEALILAALDHFRSLELPRAYLSSQTHAIPFYERLGFAAKGPEYDDAGIPHRDMYRAL